MKPKDKKTQLVKAYFSKDDYQRFVSRIENLPINKSDFLRTASLFLLDEMDKDDFDWINFLDMAST